MSTQELRKCGICGEHVLWQTNNGIGWHPIQYHDCKPVPGAWLEQARRERDEARSDAEGRKRFEQWYAESMAERDQKEEECSFYLQDRNRIAGELMLMKTLFEQAVALLREAPDKACDCEEGRTCGSCEYNTRKDAFLAGQRAPVASMATSQLSADGTP